MCTLLKLHIYIYNLNTFFPYISISVHNFFFFFLYWCYIASLLCYSYVYLYYHACLHYVNKKWSDKDTNCTCCVYCILKSLHSWNHNNLSFPWIYDMFNFFSFFFFVSDDFTLSPLGVPPAILKGLKDMMYWNVECKCKLMHRCHRMQNSLLHVVWTEKHVGRVCT